MTSVSQKIPNYVGGISQQPDELMPLGSVRDAVNVLPDVTDGLRKRTGSRLVNPLLTTKQGSWFHFNYAAEQKYIGKINFDGSVDIFNCADGLPVPVIYKAYDPTDDIGSPGETGYPDCNIDAVNSAKIAWESKKNELEIVESSYNSVLSAIENASSTEITQTYYNVVENPPFWPPDWTGGGIQPFGGDPYVNAVIYDGYVRSNGDDIAMPPPPSGWKARRGRKLYDAPGFVAVKNPNPSIWNEWIKEINVEVYEYVWYKPADVSSDLTDQLEELKTQLDSTRSEVDSLYNIYLNELAKCGYSEQGNQTRAIIDSDVAPDYLKHNVSMQIRTLTVADTTFLINPKVPVQMVQSSFTTRPTENYIELTQVAGAKVYSLELITQNSTSQPYTVVTKVGVNNAKFVDDDGSCLLQGTARETFNDGDKVNLDVRLTVTGGAVVDDSDESLSYDCNYIVNAEVLNGGTGWKVGDTFWFRDLAGTGEDYQCIVEETQTLYTPSGTPINPPQTPTDNSVVKASDILAGIKDAILAEDPLFKVEIIGNGLYVTHTDPDYVFNFATPEGQLMKITTEEVNNISDLPAQCKGGYIVKVANTDSDFDDYWAIFETEYDGIDGPGAWVETVQPGLNTVISPASMPHKLVRTAGGAFICSPISWEKRLVGDEKTNPRPSFVSRLQKKDYRYINSMAFFRNRLCMLSGDNVICSRPGDYYNFFNGSALTQVDNDPIDIAVGSSSTSANAALEDAIEIAEGLLVFAPNEQHVLSTDSEVFGPRTARFNRVGTYRYSGPDAKTIQNLDGSKENIYRGSPVFSLGNSVGFCHDSGLHTRMLEMYNIGRTQESSVNELTKPVSRLIPFGINAVAESKDNNIIALANRNRKDVYVYRYFDNDQQRVQSAWFRWQMLGTMVYHCIMDDVYWYISMGTSSSQGIPEEDRDIVSLQRIDLKDELATAFVRDKFIPSTTVNTTDTREDNDRPFQAHLDNYRIAQPSEFTYYPHINQTYFRAPLVYYKDEVDAGNLVAYMLSPTQFQIDATLNGESIYGPGKPYYFVSIGSLVPIRVEEDNLGTWFVMDGDWSKTRMMIGYQYEMRVEFPTLFPTTQKNQGLDSVVRSDTKGDLTLHRIKLNFGQAGVMSTTLQRLGRDDYTEQYECKTMDSYPANEIAFDQVKTQTVPVYSRNKDTKIILTSTHPSPATLISMEWEGDYTNRYYKRV